jgi:hypothetical protein
VQTRAGTVYQPDLPFALTISLAFLVAGAISTAFHEPWRDEAHAWLLARDSTGLVTLLRNSRYEGAPVLWHLLLLPLTRLGGLPLMSGLNLAFATGAVFLFAGFSPFERRARALFAFGYLPLYEWGTIARNYAAGVFFLFLFAVLFPRRRPVLQGVVLALAANTSVHAAIVAASALALLVVQRVRQPGERDDRALRPAFWAGVSVAGAGLVACLLQAMPASDVGLSWYVSLHPTHISSVPFAFVEGFAPFARCWFGSTVSLQCPWIAVPAAIVSGILAVAFLVTAGATLAHRRLVWIIPLGSWSMLNGLFVALMWRGTRHSGFLFIAALLGLWLAPSFPERPSSTGRLARWSVRLRRQTAPVTTGLLAFHVLAGALAVVVEIATVFSAARATAGLIRDTGLAGAPMVAEPDMIASNVVAHLGLSRAYYPTSGRWGSFAVLDSHHDESARTDDALLFDRAARTASPSDVVVVLNRAASSVAAERVGAVLVGQRSADVVREESFWVYRVPSTTSGR